MTFLTLMFGVLSGFVLGLIGAGSGLIATPLLVYVLKIPIHNAISISLTATATMTFIYLIKSLKHQLIKWNYALSIAATGIIFAPIGAKVAFYFTQKDLKILFSMLMLLASYLMWRRTRKEFPEFAKPHIPKKYRRYFLMLTGSVAGFLSGISGIGGSIIVMPVLLLVMIMKMRSAAATTIFTGFVFTSFGALSHIVINNNIDWSIAILYMIGGIIGVIAGFTLALKTDEMRLKKKFAIISGVLGFVMLVSNLIS